MGNYTLFKCRQSAIEWKSVINKHSDRPAGHIRIVRDDRMYMSKDSRFHDENEVLHGNHSPSRPAKKMRVASFEQRNVTVPVKMVSKFDKNGKKYLEPVPRIAFLVSGKYNRIPSDPDFLRDLGSFLVTLGMPLTVLIPLRRGRAPTRSGAWWNAAIDAIVTTPSFGLFGDVFTHFELFN